MRRWQESIRIRKVSLGNVSLKKSLYILGYAMSGSCCFEMSTCFEEVESKFRKRTAKWNSSTSQSSSSIVLFSVPAFSMSSRMFFSCLSSKPKKTTTPYAKNTASAISSTGGAVLSGVCSKGVWSHSVFDPIIRLSGGVAYGISGDDINETSGGLFRLSTGGEAVRLLSEREASDRNGWDVRYTPWYPCSSASERRDKNIFAPFDVKGTEDRMFAPGP